jgi:hypothetical protein
MMLTFAQTPSKKQALQSSPRREQTSLSYPSELNSPHRGDDWLDSRSMSTPSLADPIIEKAKQISNFPIKDLLRPELELFSFNFNPAKPLIETLQKLYREVAVIDFQMVPEGTYGSLGRIAQEALQILNDIKSFNPSQNAEQTRNGLISNLRARYQESHDTFAIHLAVNSMVKAQLSKQSQEADEAVAKLKSLSETYNKDVTGTLAKVNGALAEAQKVANQTGVTKEAGFFEDECKNHRNSAWAWFAGSVLLMIGIVGYAFFSVIPELLRSPEDEGLLGIIKTGIPRIVILGIGYFALIWCARNYAASRHNLIVNRHRRNALSTFKTFYLGTEDPAIRNAILMQATACIFSAQSTGYLKEEAVAQEHTKILELINAARGK